MSKPVVSTPLCSILHELRTAENSGSYFQPKLRSLKAANPKLKLLDVGSGWGHMGCSLAQALGPAGRVVGVDISPESISHAREVAGRCGLEDRVDFVQGDAYKLPFADNEFDVAHAHQVLAHLERPWDVIAEMVRVTKPGGFVAIREGDLESEIVYPAEPGLLKFHKLIATAMTARGKGGGGADTGRKLLPWALKAGVCFAAKAMTGQVRDGMVGEIAKKTGLATEEDLEEMATAWEEWAAREDSSLAMMHGEILVEK